jgi:hypothetical protein
MKKPPQSWIEYAASWQDEPMAYWVHVQKGTEEWLRATEFDPPAPKAHGKAGYPVPCVASCGMTFRFSSRAQLDVCIRMLSTQPLPATRNLTALRSGHYGPNGHWLSRLPASVKSTKGRQQAIADFSETARNPPGSFKPDGFAAGYQPSR